jgi:spore coat protein U-like protein
VSKLLDVKGIAAGGEHSLAFGPPPAVTKLEPGAGLKAGGTSVTITGTDFTGASAVKFGSTNATSFTVNSANSITAESPAGSVGKVDVIVTTGWGTSAASPADQFTYVSPGPPPAINRMAPHRGPVAGGTPVNIKGTNFTGATAVKFGSTSAISFTVNSAGSITAVSPAGTNGKVAVTVTTPNGASTSAITRSNQFRYVG